MSALRFVDPFHRPGETSPVVWRLRTTFLAQLRKQAPDVLRSLHVEVLPLFAPQLPVADRPAFEVALRTWADRWNLRDGWCLAVARETLAAWCEAPEAYAAVGLRWRIPSHPAYGLSAEEQAAWRQVVKRGGSRRHFEEAQKARGLARVPHGHSLRSPQRFAWLAAYQLGATVREIAGTSPDRQRAVRRAIREADREIGLTLRPPKRRPRFPEADTGDL